MPPQLSQLKATSTNIAAKGGNADPALISSWSQPSGCCKPGHLRGFLSKQEMVAGGGKQTPNPQCRSMHAELGGALGSPSPPPHRSLPKHLVLAAPLSTGQPNPGVSCPGWLQPWVQRGVRGVLPSPNTSTQLTGEGLSENAARTSWLPPSASGLQLGVCRAVSPVPSADCLILLPVSLQKSLSVVFFFFLI